MTFPTIAGSNSSAESTNVTSHTMSLPSSISAGNLLLAAVVTDARPGNTLGGDLGDTWTFLLADSDNLDLLRLYVYFTTATGSEGSTIGFTTNAAQCSAHRTYRITGQHESTNPFANSGNAQGSSTIDPPATNPSTWDVEDTLWIVFAGNDDGATTITDFPDNYSNTGQLSADGSADGVTIGWCTRENAVASEDPATFTLSAEEDSVSIVVAIRPSAAVPPITPSVINASVTLYGPLVQNMTLEIPSISVSTSLDNPLLIYIVSLGVITASVTMQAPTVINLGTQQNIDPNVINASATLQAPTVYHVAVVVRNIAQGSDDGGEGAGESPVITGLTIIVGAVGSHIGFRFQNVQVPKDASLVSALLNVTLGDSSKNDAEGSWYAQAADNPPTFTTTDGDFDGRTKTSASASWTTNDLGTAGTTVSTPSLLGPANEVIVRSGWTHGNSMVFLYQHNSGTDNLSLAALEHATYAEAQLTITYLAFVSTVFTASINAAATLNAPNVGAGIAVNVISASATIQSPVVLLFTQYVTLLDRIVEIPVAFGPSVGVLFGAASIKVSLLDSSRELEIIDSDYGVGFLEDNGVTLVDEPVSALVSDQE